jgi:hypothetical protein
MTLSVSGDSITFPDLSTQASAPSGFGFKNRIINGDMRIDQRNSGAAITDVGYPVDRWALIKSAPGGLSVQRSTVAPSGFTNSIGITVTSANSPSATDFAVIRQNLEGLNVADFAWGTSGAQAVTLGFWVRISIVGNYNWSLLNSAETRGYVSSFTVNVANTWEFKTLTIPGDTAGTWLTNNGTGLRCMVNLGVSSTYSTTAGSWQTFNFAYGLTGGVKLIANAGATFYITGVQLEKGSTATSFDYRDYGRELIMCQRYFESAYADSNGEAIFSATSVNGFRGRWFMKTVKRSVPTFALGSGAAWQIATPSSSASVDTINFYSSGTQYYLTAGAGAVSATASAEL